MKKYDIQVDAIFNNVDTLKIKILTLLIAIFKENNLTRIDFNNDTILHCEDGRQAIHHMEYINDTYGTFSLTFVDGRRIHNIFNYLNIAELLDLLDIVNNQYNQMLNN